jgi:hypothetical protein
MRSQSVGKGLRAAALLLACAAVSTGQNLLQLEKAPRVKAGPPANFGTTQESFYTIPEFEFGPGASTQTFSDVAIGSSSTQRYSTGDNTGFIAGAHLPDGALLTSFTFNLCDSNASNQHWTFALFSCASTDGLCAMIGTLAVSTSNVATPCAPYTQDVSGLNFAINNQTGRLTLLAIPGVADNTNTIVGATLGYKLQVSPAPGTATFNDVPTDHPFFQYIEALAKSGITGGCGSGNYCPDNFITRGQMAVFLAKGLGLQFP